MSIIMKHNCPRGKVSNCRNKERKGVQTYRKDDRQIGGEKRPQNMRSDRMECQGISDASDRSAHKHTHIHRRPTDQVILFKHRRSCATTCLSTMSCLGIYDSSLPGHYTKRKDFGETKQSRQINQQPRRV